MILRCAEYLCERSLEIHAVNQSISHKALVTDICHEPVVALKSDRTDNRDMITSLILISAVLNPLAIDTDQNPALRAQYESLCREELMLPPVTLDDLGPTWTFQLRRCITKKLNAYEYQQKLQRDETRRASRSVRLQSQVSKTRGRLSRRLIQVQSQRLWQRRLSQMREDQDEVKEKIYQQKLLIRTEIRSRESDYLQKITQRRSAMIHIRQSCSGSYGEERQTCVQMQIHNLNLLDQ